MDLNSSNRLFRCAHLNMNHTRRANIQLSQDMAKFNYDLVSVNDPYIFENKITEFPSHRKFHFNYRPLAGIIVSNDEFKIFPLFIERNVVAIEIDFEGELLVLISIYCLPNTAIENDLAVLHSLILNNSQKKILILGDFNAKSPLWGKRDLENRGKKVTDLIINNDLIIINNPDSPPTFIGPQGSSWIDLALTNIHPDKIQDWKIDDRITISDHQIMEITISSESCIRVKKNEEMENKRSKIF